MAKVKVTKQKDPAFQLAEMQRFEALVAAFKTIHTFANCSCSPEQMENFEVFESYLTAMYKPDVILKDRIANILGEIKPSSQVVTYSGKTRIYIYPHNSKPWGKGMLKHTSIGAASKYLKRIGVINPKIMEMKNEKTAYINGAKVRVLPCVEPEYEPKKRRTGKGKIAKRFKNRG